MLENSIGAGKAEQMRHRRNRQSNHLQGKISRAFFTSGERFHSQNIKVEKIARSINAFLSAEEFRLKIHWMPVIFIIGTGTIPALIASYVTSSWLVLLCGIVILLFCVYYIATQYRHGFSEKKEIGIASIDSYSGSGRQKQVFASLIGGNGEADRGVFSVPNYDLFYILPLPVDIDAVINAVVRGRYRYLPLDIAILTLYVKIDRFFGTQMFLLHEDLAHDPNFRFTEDQIKRLHAIRKKVENDIANDPIFRLTPEQERRIREFSELR